jgi:hypothetical protein
LKAGFLCRRKLVKEEVIDYSDAVVVVEVEI